jgi:acetoin utilization deacetylase AcuC-like enzyme
LRAITAQLQSTGTWDRLAVWEPALASEEDLALIHTRAHIEAMHSFMLAGGGHIDADTVVSSGSWEAALKATGALIEAAARVSAGALDNAFCVVRPPGHHATRDQAMGFCVFNNVAIAAEWLVRQRHAERIAILDYDVHHGNGTQDAFYERSDVLYVSTHQYPLYPGTGHWRETGNGYNLNISLPPGCGDQVIAAALPQVIEPAVRRYQPDFILVSLGFDAFWADPLASLRYSVGGAYTTLMRSAVELAGELCSGRLVFGLEGGYNLDALAHGADAVCRLLLGEEPATDPLGPPPEEISVAEIQPLLDAIGELHGLTTRRTWP